MYFLLLFLSIIAVLLIAIFFEPVAISFSLDTNKMDMNMSAKWMRFIRVETRVVNYRLFITVYFLGKKIGAGFKRPKKKGMSGKELAGSLHLSRTRANISYGFREPFLTGIFCAVADFAASLIESADIALQPEYVPENEYLIITAKSELNAGKTLINMLRIKTAKTRRRKNYGPA